MKQDMSRLCRMVMCLIRPTIIVDAAQGFADIDHGVWLVHGGGTDWSLYSHSLLEHAHGRARCRQAMLISTGMLRQDISASHTLTLLRAETKFRLHNPDRLRLELMR